MFDTRSREPTGLSAEDGWPEDGWPEDGWPEDGWPGHPALGDPTAQDVSSPWARWEAVHGTGETDVAIAARVADLEALVTQLQAWQARELRTLRAMRLAEQEAVHGPDPSPQRVDPDGWLPSEVGFALGLSEGQVRSRLAFGEGLERFARAGALIGRGALPAWTATRLLDHLTDLATLLAPDRLAEVEAATVTWLDARPRTVAQLNARMRRLLVRARAEYDAAHPPADRPDQPSDAPDPGSDSGDHALDSAVMARHADRRVEVRSLGDGCAELWALLPEPDALAVRAALDAAAPRLVDLPLDAGETRTRDQRRADVLVATLTGAPGCYGRAGDVPTDRPAAARVGATIEVSVPVQTLTGLSLEPGHCPGYGPVHPLTCRDLAADAASGSGRAGRAVLYDPATGRLLGLAGQVDPGPIVWTADLPVGTGYQHPPSVDDATRVRDRTCRAPGCTRPARRCDVDHVTPWPDGPTSFGNAAALCRYHHRLKTHARGWAVTLGTGDEGGDVLTWRAPTGPTRSTGPHDHRPEAAGWDRPVS